MRNVPNGYWQNDEHVLEAMRTCSSREEFKKKYDAAYKYALKHKYLFDKGNLPSSRTIWTHDAVIAKAKKFNSREIFRKTFPGAYLHALKNGYLNEIHEMIPPMREQASYEKCKESALKYNRRSDWEYGEDAKYYRQAKEHGWLAELCGHMQKRPKMFDKPLCKWNIDNVREVALKCTSYMQFITEYPGAYQFLKRNRLTHDVLSHLPRKGSRYNRCIYAAEFPDNHVYVGLTKNLERREWDHLNKENSAVFLHIVETGLQPIFKMVHSYCPSSEASELEGKVLKEYIDKVWISLNRAATGALGGFGCEGKTLYTFAEVEEFVKEHPTIDEFKEADLHMYNYARQHSWIRKLGLARQIITKEEIFSTATGYKTVKEFKAEHLSEYAAARRMGLLKELIATCLTETRIYVKWSKDDIPMIREIASKYKTRNAFQTHEPLAASAAVRLGVYDEVCAHMPERANKFITEGMIREAAKKYTNREDFIIHNRGLAKAAKRMGIYEDACSHMPERLGKIVYTEQEIFDIAKKYKRRSDFTKNNACAWKQAKKLGILEEACAHMPKRDNKWQMKDLPYIKQVAKKYKWRSEFSKNDGAVYTAALRLGVLDEVCAHMPKDANKESKFDPKMIADISKQYETRTQFRNGHPHEYRAAIRLGILDEVCKHMPKNVNHMKRRSK